MSAVVAYTSSPIKRGRRSKAEMEVIKTAMVEAVAVDHPMTVRQVFYRLVSAGVIDKTEAEYNGTVCRLLGELRRSRRIPWAHITDFTRAMRKPETFGSAQEAVEDVAQFYRRALWRDLDIRVEVWLEKDALAGVLFRETSLYDVPLMVTRGYPSLSFLWAAGEEIEAHRKPTWIYYFGDHDPSGVDIPLKVERGLRYFAPTAEIHFERVAVLPFQIISMGLPTRPTKTSDSRSKGFEGESVEVDAIPPRTLRRLCRDKILAHLSDEVLRAHEVAEDSERAFLHQWASGGAAAS